MTALKAGEVEGALRRLDPRITALLFYGPDSGLVAERARLAAERAVADPKDPFQLVKMDGDALAGDPARLLDEANTIGLFGNRRALWIRPSSRNLTPAVDLLLQGAAGDTLVVIEAGDLAKTSPLRALCERSPRALACPCYADNERDLAAVVDEALQRAGLTIDRAARAHLLAHLGGDRLASRGELDKLLLYVQGRSAVTADDIDAVLSDVSSLAADQVIDAAFRGDLAEVDQAVTRLSAEGLNASALLGAALRHALGLLPARSAVETGAPAGSVVQAWRGLNFKRHPAVERQLKLWTTGSLQAAVARLQAGVLAARQASDLDEAIASRLLLDLAREAASRERAPARMR